VALDYPFLARSFVDALEQSGSVTAARGWDPAHLVAGDTWMPLYLKQHSRGEYVFDHAWAQAYARHGLAWYPKLVTAIPYSPVSGPRWRGPDPAPEHLWEALQASCDEAGASSWHLLFPDDHCRDHLRDLPLIERQACHFRWFNRGYRSWDDFLAALTSRKRKSVRKERRAIPEQGLTVQRAVGSAIPASWWQAYYPFYASSYLKRFQEPYLSADFFSRLRQSDLLEQVMMVMAFENDEPVAAAFYLFDDRALYGRYWGSVREYHALHFELCYYQGIEFAIEQGVPLFDPGVQGEHKILRGFEPVITRSLHWLREPAFHEAVARFCQEEAQAVRHYREQAMELLPYRQAD
jgi:predicted N-acyltransferase